MIEDAHDRTRAILWCLADANPGMPLVEALGHLKAVEARLIQLAAEDERRRKEEERRAAMASMYRGSAGVADMVRDFAGDPDVARAARAGDKRGVTELLRDKTGCSALVAGQASGSLVAALYQDEDFAAGRPPF